MIHLFVLGIIYQFKHLVILEANIVNVECIINSCEDMITGEIEVPLDSSRQCLH